MSLLRAWRKSIVLTASSFIILILLYTITILYIEDVDNIHQIRAKVLGYSSKSQDKVFKNYWRIKENDDFRKISMKTITQFRSTQNFPFVSTKNDKKFVFNFINNINIPRPLDFSKCRMSNCFDFSRCRPDGPLKVNIVPSAKKIQDQSNTTLGESNVIHRSILKIIRESKYFEADANKACIFISEEDTLDRDPLSQSFLSNFSNRFDSTNRYGMNYLVFNLYSGSWPDYRENDFTGMHFGAAILAKASNSVVHHRPGFDISLPLFSYLHPISETLNQSDNTTQKPHENRSYFLSFKGKRYVFGKGSETRNSLYHLNNKHDILMLTTCRHGKKWRESNDARCANDEKYYDKHEFTDLMKNSIFCLTPRGRRLGSFRYLEALSYGCIPVVLSDGWVKPFDEIIDWSCASVQFSEILLLQVSDMLKDINVNTTARMRQNCLNLYDRYFSSTKKIILSTLSIIERRIKNRIIGF